MATLTTLALVGPAAVLLAAGAFIAGAAVLLLLRPSLLLQLAAQSFAAFSYRFRRSGLGHIPKSGAAVLVCNHVSLVDAILIVAASPRPIRFVMDHRIFRTPILAWVFRLARAIPIAPARENAKVCEQALDAIDAALSRGQLVCIFPEGRLTRDGQMGEFRRGIERIVERTPVPVIPMALAGLWGSVFSRQRGSKLRRLPQRFKSRVGLALGPPIAPADVQRHRLAQVVARLKDRAANGGVNRAANTAPPQSWAA